MGGKYNKKSPSECALDGIRVCYTQVSTRSKRYTGWLDGGYAADFKTINFNTKAIKIHYIWYYYFILSIINV